MKTILKRTLTVLWIFFYWPIQYIFKYKLYKLWHKSYISYPNFLHWDITLWDYSYISPYCQWSFEKWNTLKVGNFCSIGSWVEFISWSDHDYEKITTFPSCLLWIQHASIESIEIWNDVWIWRNAIIIKWKKIWTGAVIWAWAVVTKDIPPYAIVAWNPAKIIKYRFDEKTIKKLLESEWRNRDIQKIKNNYNLEFINNF